MDDRVGQIVEAAAGHRDRPLAVGRRRPARDCPSISDADAYHCDGEEQ
jgi:hypothetical protein